MKQGTIVNRIVMLVLFAALMIYLIVSAWQGFTGRITTVTSYSYTLDDLQEATGFLARDEYVLPRPLGAGRRAARGGGRRYPWGRRWPTSTRAPTPWSASR